MAGQRRGDDDAWTTGCRLRAPQNAERMRAAVSTTVSFLSQTTGPRRRGLLLPTGPGKAADRLGNSATLDVRRRKPMNVLWATASPVSSWIVASEVSNALAFRMCSTSAIPGIELLRIGSPNAAVGQAGAAAHDAPFVQRCAVHRPHVRHRRESLFACAAGCARPCSNTYHPEWIRGAARGVRIRRSGTCSVLHAGTTVGYQYDTLLEALALLRSTDPARAARLKVQFVGEGADDVRRAAADQRVSDLVETGGPTRRAKSRACSGRPMRY